MSKKPAPAPAQAPVDPRQATQDAHNQARQADRAKRLALMNQIAAVRGSSVIAYVTASRAGSGALGAGVGSDVIRVFRDHLALIGKVPKIDLFLITRGGNALTPLRLNSLLREFAKEVGVMVPYMAHSAGTLICLGGNEIVMGAMGELGPVDPSVSNFFNPVQSGDDFPGGKMPTPRPRLPISVEDVTSYLQLAAEKAKLTPEGMNTAFSALTEEIHPLALGNIMRQHTLIRHLVRRLLLLHMDEEKDKTRVDSIVETLTEKLYAHDYLITRNEAARMGLKVSNPADNVEDWMWDLFKLYESFLGIDREVNAQTLAAQQNQKPFVIESGVIESAGLCHGFTYKGVATKKGGDIELNVDFQAWEQYA
jgi:hypothetical protein